MAELSREILAGVLARTLEEAAFVFAEETDDAPPHEGPLLEARLRYTGAHEAELALVAPVRFAATLAANLLGEDEGGAAATGDDQDAVGELLNMIAGALVEELFGDAGAARLGIPSVRSIAPAEQARALRAATAVGTLVDEEGHRVDLSAELVRSPR